MNTTESLKRLVELKLNATQALVLLSAPAPSIAVVSRETGITYAAVNAIIRKLTSLGYISFDKHQEPRLQLTPKGAELVNILK